ncbi:MAG: hypothetical protein DRN40_02810 [Thermoplasmata archaeon]|nr:MAG: hypothetical protein DRN40_02810 [Thermoplasmata archaeon]
MNTPSGADLVEIVLDFQTLITLSANMTGHNKVKAVVCVADIAMRSVRIGRNAYSVYKETKYVDNIMDLKKVVRASGPDPVSMLLDAAIAAATITLLVLDAMDASNLIVQRALYEAAVQTGIGACIDIAMGVLVFAFPIGTAIVVGYYVAVLVLDIMKWSFGIDIKKEVWENFINLFGYATHEQENTALKNVCDVMDDIVEERREGYNNQDGIPIICVPLYPDPTK